MESVKFRFIMSTHLVYLVSNAVFWSSIVWVFYSLYGTRQASYIISLVQFLPVLLVLPLTFIIVDRFKKRNVLLTLNAMRGILCIISSAVYLNGYNEPYLLILTLVVVRGLDAIYTPAVRASVGGIQREERKRSAQFILYVITVVSSLIAPLFIPTAVNQNIGTLFLVLGLIYNLSALSYIFGGSILPEMNLSKRKLSQWTDSIKEGWGYYKDIPVVKSIILTLPLIDLSLAATTVLFPVVSKDQEFINADSYYMILLLSVGLSRLVGSFIAKRFIEGKRDGVVLSLNCSLQGIGYIMAFFMLESPLFIVSINFIGVLAGATSISINEIIQNNSPEEGRGRVFTILGFFVLLAMPFGPLISGALSSIDYSLTFFLVGVMLFFAGIPVLRDQKIRNFIHTA